MPALTRDELAALLADEDLSTAAVSMMIDPIAALEALEAEIGNGPDARERAEMARELRRMIEGDA